MYEKDFDKLWEKSKNGVLYGISARSIKGRNALGAYIHRMIWEKAWGNTKLVPPERQLINTVWDANPSKAAELEKTLSDIRLKPDGKAYMGLIVGIIGLLLISVTILYSAHKWYIIPEAIIAISGFLLFAVQWTIFTRNPRDAVTKVLDDVREQCHKILR